MRHMRLDSSARSERGGFWKMACLAVAGGFLLMGSTTSLLAQDSGGKKPAVNAITGSAWQAEVNPSAPANNSALPSDQKALIQKIDAYMNKFSDLQGQFVQTNPDSAVQKGKFYILRPGKVRFDYARPSKLHIISDGKYLTIEDHDLKTANKYPLEQTPFRMLLSKDVNLERDAVILALSSSETSATVKVADRSGQSAGQIQLYFSMPEMVLKEWVITDAQGLHTRIEVLNLVYEQKLASKLFKPSKVGLASVFED